MEEADIPKTAIITPLSLFEFFFMPFGLANEAQTFQRLMDSLFCSFPFVFVYLDDLLIFSKSRSQHIVHQEQILSLLAENGLHINPDKSLFAQEEVTFLGHQVTLHGLIPLPSHVELIIAFSPPSDVKSLQHFLGMVNFFRCFPPSIAHVLGPSPQPPKEKAASPGLLK
jgi:hypothetical protein